ncbi:hypothetical protein IWX47DRAFT_311030 [Phyllosticta citricarpa]
MPLVLFGEGGQKLLGAAGAGRVPAHHGTLLIAKQLDCLSKHRGRRRRRHHCWRWRRYLFFNGIGALVTVCLHRRVRHGDVGWWWLLLLGLFILGNLRCGGRDLRIRSRWHRFLGQAELFLVLRVGSGWRRIAIGCGRRRCSLILGRRLFLHQTNGFLFGNSDLGLGR